MSNTKRDTHRPVVEYTGTGVLTLRVGRRSWPLPLRPPYEARRYRQHLDTLGGDGTIHTDDVAAAMLGPQVAREWREQLTRRQRAAALVAVVHAWGLGRAEP